MQFFNILHCSRALNRNVCLCQFFFSLHCTRTALETLPNNTDQVRPTATQPAAATSLISSLPHRHAEKWVTFCLSKSFRLLSPCPLVDCIHPFILQFLRLQWHRCIDALSGTLHYVWLQYFSRIYCTPTHTSSSKWLRLHLPFETWAAAVSQFSTSLASVKIYFQLFWKIPVSLIDVWECKTSIAPLPHWALLHRTISH